MQIKVAIGPMTASVVALIDWLDNVSIIVAQCVNLSTYRVPLI